RRQNQSIRKCGRTYPESNPEACSRRHQERGGTVNPYRPWDRRQMLFAGMAAATAPLFGAPARAQPGRRAAHIVESQTHIWSCGKPTPSQRQEPFLTQDLLQEMSAAGVERAIIVTPSWNPSGNEYPLEAAKAY